MWDKLKLWFFDWMLVVNYFCVREEECENFLFWYVGVNLLVIYNGFVYLGDVYVFFVVIGNFN